MNYFRGLEETVSNALAEDVGSGDITALLVDSERQSRARVITRDPAILCGRPWVDEVFRQVDADVDVRWLAAEGDAVRPGDQLLALSGPARSLLTAERTALNFLQLLSGTATRSNQYVELVREHDVVLLDTRKTIPGLRLAQKYAVKTGGAENHRLGLHDAFLIKENHMAATGSMADAIARAREIDKAARVEVEVEGLEQLEAALAAGPDWIMLDNFSLDDMKKAARMAAASGIRLEASGNIASGEALQQIAATGVDYVSMGILTKDLEAIDLSMLID